MSDQLQSHVTDFYQDDAHARQYLKRRMGNLTGRFRHSRQIDLINKVIQENQLKTALEIACGPGRITHNIKGIEKGVAVDTSGSMIDIARGNISNASWSFCISDAFKMAVTDQFDLVLTMRFVWHFPLSERTQFYKIIHKCLTPDGFFVFDALTTNQFVFTPAQSQMYEERYPKISFLIDELQTHGFQVCSTMGYLNHPNLQHFMAKVGDVTRIKRPVLAILHSLEEIRSIDSEEYIIVCRKK